MSMQKFLEIFGEPATRTAIAPGRVNLIGEHLDYNGGVVLPTALPVQLNVSLRLRDDNLIMIASDRFDGLVEHSLGASKQGAWSDYALGAVQLARNEGILTGGADLFVESTIPDGAGLSSSAALIVGILKAVRGVNALDLSDEDIAKLARRVENEFIGMPCGIMDQMAVAVAQKGQAIALDTKSLTYDVIDLPADFHMAVVHSGQHRKLSDGRYAERKVECDEAKEALGTQDLCLLGGAELDRLEHLPAHVQRRVRHCISEHKRTVEAAEALRTNDLMHFGALMNESHISMRDNFEMSTPVIDALVADAVEVGALGARLTGGGFGGCIVACVPSQHLETWKQALLGKNPSARFIC